MYSRVIENGSVNNKYNFLYLYTSLLRTFSLISNKIGKLVSKETFVEASKVVDKPSKVI